MTWNGTGRGIKALAVTLALGVGMTACSRDYTEGYLYVTNAKNNPGSITAYAIDYQSGALSQLADSPIPTGRNPVTLVAAPNGQYLYVLNHDDSTVVEYTIGTDGKIYAANTYNVVQGNNLIGTFPVAAAIDAAGAYLYVAFTYQNGYTTLSPGPGGVAIFPIHTDGTLGAAVTNTTVGTTAAHPLPYIPVGDNPTAIVTTQKGNNVYVVDDEFPVNASQFGVLLAFNENTATGALTQVAGTVSGGFSAGTQPSALAADPTGRFLYVTDSLTNQMYAYNLQANGAPVPNISSPFTTGSYPVSVTVDPRGTFVYVANFTSGTVSAYVINTATGALSGAGGAAMVGTGPTCVVVEPALGIYLYTSNHTDNTVSAQQLNANTGALTSVQNTPFTSQGQPTCAAAVTNGAHATQIVE